LFQIFWWHFVFMRVVFLLIINNYKIKMFKKIHETAK